MAVFQRIRQALRRLEYGLRRVRKRAQAHLSRIRATPLGVRARLLARRGRSPRISIILRARDTSKLSSGESIASVEAQIYGNWELCSNGFMNAAATSPTGKYLAFLDHGDLLSADALAEIAIYAADHPDADVIYSDHDESDALGRRSAPQFKPDWSPTLLLSCMYVGHLLVVRRSLFEALGGIRPGFEGSELYELVLRASEQARHIGHIPKILYHRRAAFGSAAEIAELRGGSMTGGLRAVKEAYVRRKIEAEVAQPEWARAAQFEIYSPRFPDDGPRVVILIPTHNRAGLLQSCLDSLATTSYRNYQVLILDDESDDPITNRLLAQCGHRVLRVARTGGRFSFARINNFGVREANADYVLFLNDDTQVIEPRWLSQMMGHARMQGVGAVGAKLIYSENAIQHAGIVHECREGMPHHVFRDVPADELGYLAYLKVAREYSAVTGACMLTPRRLFLDMGGFDEKAFAITFNDVDYCYRLNDRGYRCIFCPDATLIHHERQTRASADLPTEVAEFRRRYRGRAEPYYNPNLSLENERFED